MAKFSRELGDLHINYELKISKKDKLWLTFCQNYQLTIQIILFSSLQNGQTICIKAVGYSCDSPGGLQFEHNIRLNYNTSNNEDEYEALIIDLQIAMLLEAKMIEIFNDSQLIVNQVLGKCTIREPNFKKYLDMVNSLQKNFKKLHQSPSKGRQPTCDYQLSQLQRFILRYR